MATSKNKESVAYNIQDPSDAPVKDPDSKTQAAVKALIQCIIEAGESARRA